MWSITDVQKQNRNTLKATFALVIGPIKITGFTYHCKNNSSWIGLPGREYIDRVSRETKYCPLVRFVEKSKQDKFRKWAIAQIKENFTRKGG